VADFSRCLHFLQSQFPENKCKHREKSATSKGLKRKLSVKIVPVWDLPPQKKLKRTNEKSETLIVAPAPLEVQSAENTFVNRLKKIALTPPATARKKVSTSKKTKKGDYVSECFLTLETVQNNLKREFTELQKMYGLQKEKSNSLQSENKKLGKEKEQLEQNLSQCTKELEARMIFEAEAAYLRKEMRFIKKKVSEISKLLGRTKSECFAWKKDYSKLSRQLKELKSENISLKQKLKQEKERNIASFNDLKSFVPNQSQSDESY
jgi:chromosome segregation ATPase